MTTLRRLTIATLALVLFAGLAACGDDDDTAVGAGNDDPTSPAAGACLEGSTDCDDDPSQSDGGDEFDSEAATERARSLIGVAEADLDADVRIARAGDEHFMLTEDYVLGRITVELDPDDEGTMRVTSAVVELPDGPLTVTE